MQRRTFLAGVSMAAILAGPAFGQSPPKEKTVTLEISGMTWTACVDVVQSALESVKGVEEVSVSLSKSEAVVKYDAEKVKVEDLIKAVKEAYGMNLYDAKVKKE